MKETSKMMTRAKKNYSSNKLLPPAIFQHLFLTKKKTALAHIVGNIVKEELQAHEVVLQEIVSSNLKVTNERLEKLSGEVSDIKESLEFTQKQIEDEIKEIKKDVEILQKI